MKLFNKDYADILIDILISLRTMCKLVFNCSHITRLPILKMPRP